MKHFVFPWAFQSTWKTFYWQFDNIKREGSLTIYWTGMRIFLETAEFRGSYSWRWTNCCDFRVFLIGVYDCWVSCLLYFRSYFEVTFLLSELEVNSRLEVLNFVKRFQELPLNPRWRGLQRPLTPQLFFRGKP